MSTLTQQDLLDGYDMDWDGYGYLLQRQKALVGEDPDCPARPDLVARADARIIDEANRRGWSKADLFNWANSRTGRFYGDAWFGNPDDDELRERHLRDGLLDLPRA